MPNGQRSEKNAFFFLEVKWNTARRRFPSLATRRQQRETEIFVFGSESVNTSFVLTNIVELSVLMTAQCRIQDFQEGTRLSGRAKSAPTRMTKTPWSNKNSAELLKKRYFDPPRWPRYHSVSLDPSLMITSAILRALRKNQLWMFLSNRLLFVKVSIPMRFAEIFRFRT